MSWRAINEFGATVMHIEQERFIEDIVGKVKSSRPSLEPTGNSRQASVGYGPGQRLMSRHTSVKIYWSQPRAP